MPTPLESSFFDTIAGLPLHPLVVHFAVVILPLAAIALVLLVIVPRWADRYGVVTLLALAGGTAAAFVAKESGEALAARVGEPKTHASFGDVLPFLAVALLLLAGIWYFLHRRSGGAGKPRSLAATTAGILAALAALGVTGVTVVVGHTGAEAAWGDVVAAGAQASDQPSAAETRSAPTSASPTATTSGASTTASASASTSGTYTLAEVATHSDASSCWSVVSGEVYDLTEWISKHPGGENRILGMCGKDATSAFEGQHSADSRPKEILATFKIGKLG